MINRALIKHIWRDLRHREIRILLCSILVLQSLGNVAGAFCFNPEEGVSMSKSLCNSVPYQPIFWVLIWGAGVVGIKISRGTLALVLSRPITTSSLVVSTWLAIAIAAFITHLVYLALHSLQLLLVVPYCFNPGGMALQAFKALFTCLSTSAMLVLFSTLVSGVKDLGLVFLVFVLGQTLSATSDIPVREIKQAVLRHLCQWLADAASATGAMLQFAIRPELPMTLSLLFSWNTAVGFVSIVAITLACLSLAIARLNTLEVSYAAD